MAGDLAGAADELAGGLASRIASGSPSLSDAIALLFIGDEGIAERWVTPNGEVVDQPSVASSTVVRWEDVDDALAVERGDARLGGIAHAGRLAIDGAPAEINALAGFLEHVRSETRGDGTSGLVPFVSRSVGLTDEQVLGLIGPDRSSKVAEQLQCQAEAYELVRLAEFVGEFRGRWRVEDVEMDLVVTRESSRCEASSVDTKPAVSMTFESFVWWGRWVCQEQSFMDLALPGLLILDGDISIIQNAANVLPHVK